MTGRKSQVTPAPPSGCRQNRCWHEARSKQEASLRSSSLPSYCSRSASSVSACTCRTFSEKACYLVFLPSLSSYLSDIAEFEKKKKNCIFVCPPIRVSFIEDHIKRVLDLIRRKEIQHHMISRISRSRLDTEFSHKNMHPRIHTHTPDDKQHALLC